MTSALDQKGLAEAALAYKRQHRDTCYPDAMDGEALIAAESIVRAYLSTVIPAEIAGVVERCAALAETYEHRTSAWQIDSIPWFAKGVATAIRSLGRRA